MHVRNRRLSVSLSVERRHSADSPSTNIDYKSGGGTGSNGEGGGSNEDSSDASFRLGFPSGVLAAGCRR